MRGAILRPARHRRADGQPRWTDRASLARGIEESAPGSATYLHGGRLLTLEDTVELVNRVLPTSLTQQETDDLPAPSSLVPVGGRLAPSYAPLGAVPVAYVVA